MTYRPSPARRRVFRAIHCKPFTRIQPRVVCGIDHKTARLLREIGWYAGAMRKAA